jgi:predicted nucleic acid-binding protein
VAAVALVDTGALLALANPRDQYHADALAISRGHLAGGGRLVGTILVLAELHGHLLHRRGPELARAVVTDLMADPAYEWVEVTADLVREALARWLARFRDQRFSLTDAVSFEVMRRGRIRSAFAFDSDFTRAGFELLSVAGR